MAGPPGGGGWFGSSDLEGVPVFDNPFEGLALLEFEGRGQRSRTDQVILAVASTALDNLELSKVAHGSIIAI
jgi:hypothetical protein